jgi:hypothetical protein
MYYEYIVNKQSDIKQHLCDSELNRFIKENKSYIMEKIFDIIEDKYIDNEKVICAFHHLVTLFKEQKEMEEINIIEDFIEEECHIYDNMNDIELYKTLFIGKENKTKKQVISEIFKKT